MPKIITRVAPLFFAISFVFGCATELPTQQYPNITFSHLKKIKIDVGKIDIVSRFQPPLTNSHIEHLLPIPPSKALEQWLRDRFQPIGQSGRLSLVIEDAQVTATPLKLDTSFKGQITKQQSQLYQMAVQASLHIRNPDAKILATASARAERSITAREDLSLNDRHQLWLETVNEMMTDFNSSIEPNIQDYLGSWLR